MGTIVYNGVRSDSFGLVVEHPPNYQYPEREYDLTHIPGRNGDYINDYGSYQNVPRKYEVAIGEYDGDFDTFATRIADWLHSGAGYLRLEDSYQPEYYRMAMYMEENEIENILAQAGRVTISFNCMPQRFLKSGEAAVYFGAHGSLTNPTNQKAVPIVHAWIDVNQTGVVRVNGYVISIKVIDSTLGDLQDSANADLLDSNGNKLTETRTVELIIDCVSQDVYSGSYTNRNSVVTLGNDEFPVLNPGENPITFFDGIKAVSVTPNWWRI